MTLWRRRSRAKRRKAVAGILAALLLFVMLFTVGTGYFLFVNQSDLLYTQALSTRANGLQSTLAENLALATGEAGNGHITVAITNQGPQAATIVELFVTSPSGTFWTITKGATPPLPLALNSGVTSSSIDTGVSYTSGTYEIKALTQRGATFSATYPPTAISLAAQALSSGAIGDLYLAFSSYSFYTISRSGCPSGQGYSSYCLQTSSGNTGSAFAIPVNTYQYSLMAFSVVLTDLNTNQKDIVLDQFTLMYQTTFYGNEHQDMSPWYIVSVGTQSGNLIPIMNSFQPVVLKYAVPATVYFATSNCVTASQGPNYGNCYGYTINGGGMLQNCPCPSGGTLSNVFILTSGWELASGSYQVNNLQYSALNYGQNTPFVSTLYY